MFHFLSNMIPQLGLQTHFGGLEAQSPNRDITEGYRDYLQAIGLIGENETNGLSQRDWAYGQTCFCFSYFEYVLFIYFYLIFLNFIINNNNISFQFRNPPTSKYSLPIFR